jgi:diketogulonate reductase-like aldo/keto reductase
MSPQDPHRRRLLAGLAAGAALASLPRTVSATDYPAIFRTIPASGEKLTAIGMGSWLTFDVAGGREREPLLRVLQVFFEGGGRLLDSSPMYGYAEEVLGLLTPRVQHPAKAFTATKVWTPTRFLGERQMENSLKLWGVKQLDLLQIHNMLDWETHLVTLKEWKKAGRIRYIGITTSHGRRHEDLEAAMKRERFDFVQFTLNLADRSVEDRLLPLAADRGAAVILNRPFDGGDLFGTVKGKPLPGWAAEIDCANWAQVFLKYAISHPAVTCAIPATSNVAHMAENLGAMRGRLPDAALRKRMVSDFARL